MVLRRLDWIPVRLLPTMDLRADHAEAVFTGHVDSILGLGDVSGGKYELSVFRNRGCSFCLITTM